jgi:hypothetical protein
MCDDAGMKGTFQVINRMVEDGVIRRYAICGAVAALNYLEPMLTDGLDILVALDEAKTPAGSGLMSLEAAANARVGPPFRRLVRSCKAAREVRPGASTPR